MAHQPEPKSVPPEGLTPRSPPELQVIDGDVFLRFPLCELARGATLSEFAVRVPGVTFPFDLTQGALKLQRRRLTFVSLEVLVDSEKLETTLSAQAEASGLLEDVCVQCRTGYLEVSARLPAPSGLPVTFKVGFAGEGERVRVALYDFRLYGPHATASPALAVLLSQAISSTAGLTEAALCGGSGFSFRVLPRICQLIAMSHGFKVPELLQGHLTSAEVSSGGLLLGFSADGTGSTSPAGGELHAVLDGVSALGAAESCLAEGRLEEAKAAWSHAFESAENRLFVLDRLLTFAVTEIDSHDWLLEVCHSGAPCAMGATPLWVEAVVREQQNEKALAADRYLALFQYARERGELLSARQAAQAAVRMAWDVAPPIVLAAAREMLLLWPSDLDVYELLAHALRRTGTHMEALETLGTLRTMCEARGELERLERADQLAGDIWNDESAVKELGRAYELRGDHALARDCYARAALQRPLDEDLASALERLHRQAGEDEQLIRFWTERARALAALGRMTSASALWLKAAKAHWARGEHDAALEKLRLALPGAPFSQRAEVLLRLAEAEAQAGQNQQASEYFETLAQETPPPRAAARLYFRAAQLVDEDRERQLLEKALGVDAHFAPARLRRAELNLQLDSARAFFDLEAVLAFPDEDSDGPNPRERATLSKRAARIAMGLNDVAGARRHLAAYVASEPTDVEALRLLCELHHQANDVQALWSALQQLLAQLSPSERQPLLRQWAELSVLLDRKEAAIDALRQLRAFDSDDGWATLQLLGLLGKDDAEREGLIDVALSGSEGEDRAELLAERAELYFHAQQLEHAVDDWTEAARLSKNPEPHYRALVELARWQKDEAAELFTWVEAAACVPAMIVEASQRLLTLSRARLDAGDLASAKTGYVALSRLEQNEPDRAELFWGLAQLALRSGDVASVLDPLARGAETGEVAQRVRCHLLLADVYEKQGWLEQAAHAFEAALMRSPRDPQAIAGLKRLLRAMGNWAGLCEVLAAEAMRAPKPQAGPLWLELADLYLRELKAWPQAEAAFRKALQANPEEGTAKRQLAHLLIRRGEAKPACQLVEEVATTLAPHEAACLLREMVEPLRLANEEALALKLSRKAAALSPPEDEALWGLLQLLYSKGAVQEAIPWARRACEQLNLEAHPERFEEAHLLLADLQQAAGDFEGAEATLKRLRWKRPLCSAAAERLSDLLGARSIRQGLEALSEFAQSLSASERVGKLLEAIGRSAHRDLNDTTWALHLLRRAVRLCPQSIVAHRALADLFEASGRIPDLLDALARVAELEQALGDKAAAAAALERLAECAMERGRFDEALTALESSYRLVPSWGAVELALQWAERRGESMPSLLWLERAVQNCGQVERKARLLLALAEAQTRAGQKEAALESLSSAHRLMPEEVSRAQARGLYQTSLKLAENASPSQAEALYRRAASLFDDPVDAVEALVPLSRLQPQDAQVVDRAVEGLQRLGRHDEIQTLCERAAEANTGTRAAELLLRAAWVCEPERADEAHALALLEKAVQADPHHPLILEPRSPRWLLAAAETYEAQGQAHLAAEALEQIARAFPDELSAEVLSSRLLHLGEPEAALTWGFAPLMQQGEYQQALALADKANDAPRVLQALWALAERGEADAASRLAQLLWQTEDAQGLRRLLGQGIAAEEIAQLAPRLQPDSPRVLVEVALQALASLPANPERLSQRLHLCRALGNTGEALRLSELLTEDPLELRQILEGYLQAELLPFAATLAQKLLAVGCLDGPLRRQLAERFSSSAESAELAVRLWPEILAQDLHDADGWTLFAEALGHLGRSEAATLADGFGAALTWSAEPAPQVALSPLRPPVMTAPPLARPSSAVPLRAQTMPRVSAALEGAMSGFGVGPMGFWLDVQGGPEAYLLSEDTFVLGAGALSCFGSSELTFLSGLAIVLGSSGHLLAGPGDAPNFLQAVLSAFHACPSALAACRVVAYLDGSVRGRDPNLIELSSVLKKSAAFRALAEHALRRLHG